MSGLLEILEQLKLLSYHIHEIMRLFVSYLTGNSYLRHRFDQRRINKRKCMDNLLRCLSFSVVSLLVVHFVAESRVGGTVCGGPYADNGRPVHIPAEEYAKYCCKADKYGSWTASSRFDCASEGGCCGEVDKQYCCDRDKIASRIALQLGLGITGGALVLLAIIALIVYCCVRSFYSDLNEEIYCDGCCRCRVRRKEQRINYWEEVARDGHRTSQQRSVISSTDEPDTDPEPISLMVPTAPPAGTPTAPPSAPPSAPPAYDPSVELDAPPPSYSDVIRNPHIFPQTGKRQASTTV